MPGRPLRCRMPTSARSTSRSASRVLALSLSRGKLAALVCNLEDTLVRAVPKRQPSGRPAQRLHRRSRRFGSGCHAGTCRVGGCAPLRLGGTGARRRGRRGRHRARPWRARGAACGRDGFLRSDLHHDELRADSEAADLGVTPRLCTRLTSRGAVVPGIRSCRAGSERVPRDDRRCGRNESAIAVATGLRRAIACNAPSAASQGAPRWRSERDARSNSR